MTISPGTPPIADGETALRYLSSESLSGSPFRKDRVMRAGKKIKRSTEGTSPDDLHVWLRAQPQDRLVDLL